MTAKGWWGNRFFKKDSGRNLRKIPISDTLFRATPSVLQREFKSEAYIKVSGRLKAENVSDGLCIGWVCGLQTVCRSVYAASNA